LTKDNHLAILRKVSKRHFKIHGVLIFIILISLSINGFFGVEAGIIRTAYQLAKSQIMPIIFREQLYTLLRSKSLTVNQAMDLSDVILDQNRIPITLALAMIKVESCLDPNAKSKKGAKGLTQITPIVQKEYSNHPIFKGKTNQIYDVSVNVKLGLFYLADLHERFQDWHKALRAYNAGPENANNKEFDGYANLVLKVEKDYQQKLNSL